MRSFRLKHLAATCAALLLAPAVLTPSGAQEAVEQAASSPPPAAADAAASEWPCISAKVVEISPAQIWDGPPLEGLENWRNDDAIRKLSEFLVARRIPLEEVEAQIKTYAEQIPEAERDGKLTLLFSGVLSRINDERKIVISGIERFHKRQLARAKQIEKEGLALPDLSVPMTDTPVPAGEIDKQTEEEMRFNWDVRVFQEKQQNIPIACEIPQLIEERAGAIARAIRSHMKS